MDSQFTPKRYVTPGTGFHTLIGWSAFLIVAPTVILVTALTTMGLALIPWVVAGLFYWHRVRKARARLKGSALRVGPNQLPEIHAVAHELSVTLGIHEPDVYIVESYEQNAFAIKHGGKHCVVLVDDVVHGALATGNAQVLAFIIAHELAHHALGHTGLIRRIIAARYSPLSRLDEFSCDAVAHALVQEETAVRDAMTLLLVGPQLFTRVNKVALDKQAREVFGDPVSRRSESGLSHPLLLRRYARLVQAPSAEALPSPEVVAFDLPESADAVPALAASVEPVTENGFDRWAPPASPI